MGLDSACVPFVPMPDVFASNSIVGFGVGMEEGNSVASAAPALRPAAAWWRLRRGLFS